MRGVRGATTVTQDTEVEIFAAVQEMLQKICTVNGIMAKDIVAVIFSVTKDIKAAFPAAGARALPDFANVPLIDVQQMEVTGSLAHCIRVLMLVNTEKEQIEMKHVYLQAAKKLRPDLSDHF